jgi:hypothetical protein
MINKTLIDGLIKNLHQAINEGNFILVNSVVEALESQLNTENSEYVITELEKALVVSLQKEQVALLFLLEKEDYIDISECVTIALLENYNIAEAFLFQHMIKNGMQTWNHLPTWQAQLMTNNQLEPPRINTTSMAKYYINYLISISADAANDDICLPALLYKAAIVNLLIEKSSVDTLEESIGTTNHSYNNGLSKFLHTYKSETKSSWRGSSPDQSIEQIKAQINQGQKVNKQARELK